MYQAIFTILGFVTRYNWFWKCAKLGLEKCKIWFLKSEKLAGTRIEDPWFNWTNQILDRNLQIERAYLNFLRNATKTSFDAKLKILNKKFWQVTRGRGVKPEYLIFKKSSTLHWKIFCIINCK